MIAGFLMLMAAWTFPLPTSLPADLPPAQSASELPAHKPETKPTKPVKPVNPWSLDESNCLHGPRGTDCTVQSCSTKPGPIYGPCYWLKDVHGHGKGRSFWLDANGKRHFLGGAR